MEESDFTHGSSAVSFWSLLHPTREIFS